MEAKPCAMAYPVTLAVIIPSVPAARATVDMCPMVTTDARMKEYSKTCELGKRISYQRILGIHFMAYAKTGREYRVRVRSSSRNI